jgi:four helix bundle protein
MIVWQRAMQLVTSVYRLTKTFPPDERYGLALQMRRAAVSVPSNIAEGQARQGPKGFTHFLSIARGSLQELETQLQLSIDLA